MDGWADRNSLTKEAEVGRFIKSCDKKYKNDNNHEYHSIPFITYGGDAFCLLQIKIKYNNFVYGWVRKKKFSFYGKK